MTYTTIPGIASGLALFAVAYYSLRLNRFIATPRMGTVLCGGLSLLAVLSLISGTGVYVPAWSGLFHAAAAIVVVVGLAHIEKALSEHVRVRQTEEEARRTENKKRSDAVSLLEKKIAELTKANEQWPKSYGELEKAAAGFQAEAAEQTRLATELAETNKQMAISHQDELRRSAAALQARVVEQERLRVEQERLRIAQERSRAEQDRSQSQQVQLRAEMEKTCKQLAEALAACSVAQAECSAAQANTTILQSVRTLLSDATASVETVVDHAAKFRSTNTSHITKLLRPTAKKTGSRTAVNGLGKRLPNSVAVLSRQLTREQSALVQQIDTLKKKLERIQKVAAADSESANGSHVLQCADTDTATTTEAGDAHDTTRCTREEANGAGVDHNDLPVLN